MCLSIINPSGADRPAAGYSGLQNSTLLATHKPARAGMISGESLEMANSYTFGEPAGWLAAGDVALAEWHRPPPLTRSSLAAQVGGNRLPVVVHT